MTSRHFDVIVLGRSLGALTTAALLARRDFQVLLISQRQEPPSYRFERFFLKRRAFTMLFGASPVWKRILQDLAQSPTFRRRTVAIEPMFAMLSQHRRLRISARPEAFNQEVDREFPEVRQLVDEFYSLLASANAAIDDAFSRDVVWPPGNLFERLEVARGDGRLPFNNSAAPTDLLAKFPIEHPYRELATLPAAFATHVDYGLMGLSPLAMARLHGSWSRGLIGLEGGEDELEDFLFERFQSHGGTFMQSGVDRILVRGGRVNGVQLDGVEDPIGTEALITSLSGEAVGELARGEGITKKARFDWPTLTPTAGRFTVSIVVGNECLPQPLARESFLLPKESPHPNPRHPVVHLQTYPSDALPSGAAKDETLLVAEAILPADGALSLSEARHAVVETVRFQLPFLDQHVRAIDSVHDGLPLQDFRTGQERRIDRVHVKGTTPKPEFMECQWTVEPSGAFGVMGEPLRGPIQGSYLVGKTALPALGQEGELLAAWGVARILTKRDRARQRRRRQLWTKIETS
jgi:phytoene dehydrogenase-like protein